MGIRYEPAPDIQAEMLRLARRLGMEHIDGRVRCVRSHGSGSRWTLARCHAMSRVFQTALDCEMHYVIEVIAATFDGLSAADKTKTLIHEMLHIPLAFGGGLKSHRYVNSQRVNRLYRRLTEGEAARPKPGARPRRGAR